MAMADAVAPAVTARSPALRRPLNGTFSCIATMAKPGAMRHHEHLARRPAGGDLFMATPLDEPHPQRVSALHPRLIEVARVSIPVSLATEEAQRVLTRRFASYEHSVYFLFFVAREYMSAKRLEPVQRSLKERLEITMNGINECIDEANAWANARQLCPRRKEHLPRLWVEIGVCHSLSMRYLEVIERLDEALWRLHALGRLDHKQRGKWKARAAHLIRGVRDIDVEARRDVDTLRRNAPDLANHRLD